MSRRLDRWWHVPGPASLLDGWIDDLENSKSLVFLMPRGTSLPDPLVALERAHRLKRTLEVLALVDTSEEPLSPGELLGDEVGMPRDRAPRKAANWLDNGDLSSCLVVHAPTGPDATGAWLEFVEEFAEATRNSARKQDCPRFALLVSAESLAHEYVPRTPNLGVVQLGMATTRLDLMCHVSRVMEPTGDPRELELRAGLCVELCAGDLDALGELAAFGLDALCEVDQMVSWWLEREPLTHTTPAQTHWARWANGHVRRVDGRALEAPCRCDEDYLRRWIPRAIWGAQARTLIPVLDAIRRRAIERFGEEVELPHKRETGFLVHEIDRLEIGDLAFLASNRALGHVTTGELQELYAMKQARNELCHNQHLLARQARQVLEYGRDL